MRVKKNFKLDPHVAKLLQACADCTGGSDTRVVESALVAYGAQILGRLHPTVEQARSNLLESANKNRKFT
jgi:hypothetical protein